MNSKYFHYLLLTQLTPDKFDHFLLLVDHAAMRTLSKMLQQPSIGETCHVWSI